MEEFEKLVAESFQAELLPVATEDTAPTELGTNSAEGSRVQIMSEEEERSPEDQRALAEQNRESENDPAA
jgi:hypothetical protein